MPSVNLPTDITRDELRDHALGLLDAVRHQYEAARLNRLRYMQLGKRYGLTSAEIGDVLGISDSAVRQAIRRAGDGD